MKNVMFPQYWWRWQPHDRHHSAQWVSFFRTNCPYVVLIDLKQFIDTLGRLTISLFFLVSTDILKHFNHNLTGYSLGMGKQTTPQAFLNQAVAGAKSKWVQLEAAASLTAFKGWSASCVDPFPNWIEVLFLLLEWLYIFGENTHSFLVVSITAQWDVWLI